MNIRPIIKSDILGLKSVLDNCELFPADYLDEMIVDYLENPNTDHLWFTVAEEGKVLSIAYCAPMKFTNGTYNLYAIGVHNDYQGKGIGKKMMVYLEKELKSAGHRILIVETSSTDNLALTREFYNRCGYRKEASIHNFWDDGDDKVVFWKKL
ncbi:MAG: ribosomal protein S18 acetylase RimI-like enzyme [Saprospiraceae bacterium]|jgi:ribosomal protein S18 acetylase RimI-like enzyme|tara:strand:- start:1000 stop:1458 length:459 start_codon:yes stop_codon:yes gene_type:complete